MAKPAQKEDMGVIFDNQYTDSLLKILLSSSYPTFSKWIPTRRSIPRKEILLALLLFGKATLSRPLWLKQDELRVKDKDRGIWATAVKEELFEWIPVSYYEEAFARLGKFNKLLDEKIWARYDNRVLPLDEEISAIFKADLQGAVENSEITHDLLVHLNSILYPSPVISSNLNHSKYRSGVRRFDLHPAILLLSPYMLEDPRLGPYEVYPPELGLDGGSFIASMNIRKNDDYLPDMFPHFEGSDDFYFSQSVVLDSLLSSCAVERMAGSTGLPVQTTGAGEELSLPRSTIGDEAYQLLKIQYKEVRYPVIETISDVLRLRESKHLDSYRSVIAEYSHRMREELEAERVKVLEEFRKDLELASKTLASTYKWGSRISDCTFYLSIPLAIIGFLAGIPSGVLTIPISGGARYVMKKKRKELDWIMFGKL